MWAVDWLWALRLWAWRVGQLALGAGLWMGRGLKGGLGSKALGRKLKSKPSPGSAWGVLWAGTIPTGCSAAAPVAGEPRPSVAIPFHSLAGD